MAVDFLAKRDIMEQILPEDTFPVTRTSGVSGAWSAYGQVIASLANPFILCGAYISEVLTIAVADGAQAGQVNVQIVTGAVSSEVLIAEGHGGLALYPGLTATDVVAGWTGRTIFFEPKLIPAGTRLAWRVSASSAKAVKCVMYLFGYDARYFAQPLKCVNELRYIRGCCSPTQGATVWPVPGATAVSTHAITAYAYGTPVQFIASAASPLLITGLFGSGTANADNHPQAQIGVGAAGSEQWMSKVGIVGTVTYVGPFCDCYLPRPLYVKTGEAVSVRIAGQANRTINVALKGFALK